MPEQIAESRELRRLIRDLVALATTPAGWVGREPAQIVDGIADILRYTLRVEAVHVLLGSGNPAEGIRCALNPGFAQAVQQLRAQFGTNALLVETLTFSDWPSPLRVAICPVGLSGGDGFVAVGCSRPSFPSEAESLLLSVAANQAAIAVQTAQLRAKAKLEQQALRESEQRFYVVTEAAPIMVWMSGTDKLCYYFSKGWLDFVGRSMEQEVGNGWVENVHPDDLDRCVQTYVACFDARQPFEMEYRLRHRSGEYRWILDHGVPRYAPDGTFEGYVGGCLDIDDKKEASEAKYKLAAIVESSNDAIVSKNLKGIVTSWNPAAEGMFGYTAEEMIGSSILTIIPPELHSDETRILETIARGERIEHFETVRLTKSGERIDVSLTISPVRDESGRIIGAAKIARDITELKKSEHALRTTERLASVGRLAATVAHEINNPLEAVVNLLYLAKERSVRGDVRELLAGAEEEVERISHLTKQTLGFYRDSRTPSPMKIGAMLSPLVSVFASRSRNKGVEICPEIRQDPEIYAIAGEVRQVIANLLSNSIDAVPRGGRIRIRIARVGARHGQQANGVRITVADTGPGIPRSVREKMFEPFFTTKKEVGTGLGLWVCKNIVDKHHGKIQVKSSTVPGRTWTVFSVFLPSLQAIQEALRTAV